MHEKYFNFTNFTSDGKLITMSEVANVSESGWLEEGKVYVWFHILFYLPFLVLSFETCSKVYLLLPYNFPEAMLVTYFFSFFAGLYNVVH